MKHLTDEKILELASKKKLSFTDRLRYGLHLATCKICRKKLSQERNFAKDAGLKLRKITSHAHPSKNMDNRVYAAISQIATQAVVKAPIMARWVTSLILVVVMISSSYGIFFYAPLVGAAHETPAEAYVSSRLMPVMASTDEVIPEPGHYLKSEAFLNVWCDRLMVCASEYTRMVYLEGNNISDVFKASILGHEAGVSTESVLSLLRSGKTWGQILSELDISFTSQLSIHKKIADEIAATTKEIGEKATLEVTAYKHEDGHISSPVPIPEEVAEKLQVGESKVEVTDDGFTTGKIEPNPTPSLYTGVVTKIAAGNSAFTLKTADDAFTVRITYKTEMLRYNDYFVPSQLMVGHICTIDGEWVDGELIAKFLDAKEPIRETEAFGTVLDFDEETITVAGFGSALYVGNDSEIKGELEVGAKVVFTASGNEIEGFTVDTLTSTPRPEPKPTPEEPKAEFTGVVVGVDINEKLILLHDGSSVFYNKNTTFANGMTPSVGQKITSTALSSNTLKEEKFQDQAIMVAVDDNPDLTDRFEVAGEFTDHKCLNGCNWIKPEGVTEVELDHEKTSTYLIIPMTEGHSVITPSYKGMTVIMEGFRASGVNLVTKVTVVDPREVKTHSGIITDISEKNILTLDDGTEIAIRPYTKSSNPITTGAKFQFSYWEDKSGNKKALEITAYREEKKIIKTDWLIVVVFDGEKLELSDGTVIMVDENTAIKEAILGTKLDETAVKAGLKVLCEYEIKGGINTALEISVFVNP